MDFWIFDIFTKLEKILRPPKSKSQKFPSVLGFSERIPKRLKIRENVYLLGKSYTEIKIPKFPKVLKQNSKAPNFLKVPIVYFFEDYKDYSDSTYSEGKDLNYSFLVKIFSGFSTQQKEKLIQILKNVESLDKTG